jgi:hypothetical protein
MFWFWKTTKKDKETFPILILAKPKIGKPDTITIWKKAFYETACDFTILKDGREPSFLEKLIISFKAFRNPPDFVRRVMAAHAKEIAVDMHTRVYSKAKEGEF